MAFGALVFIPRLPVPVSVIRVLLLVIKWSAALLVLPNFSVPAKLLPANFQLPVCAFTVCKPNNVAAIKAMIADVDFNFIVKCFTCLKLFKAGFCFARDHLLCTY